MPLEQNNDQLNIKGTGGFDGALARYYSEFLATDFKKGRLPKRRFQIKDKKGRRTGIPLEKFPSFLTILAKKLSKDFGSSLEVTVINGAHTSSLSNIVIKVIRSEIEKLTLDEFHIRSSKILKKFKGTIKSRDVDLEIEAEKLIIMVLLIQGVPWKKALSSTSEVNWGKDSVVAAAPTAVVVLKHQTQT